MHRSPRLGALASVVFAFTSACGGGTETIEGWSEESHGKNATPAYAVVFPQEQVKRFDLIIAPSDWQTMQDDMTAMAGEFGAGGGMGGLEEEVAVVAAREAGRFPWSSPSRAWTRPRETPAPPPSRETPSPVPARRVQAVRSSSAGRGPVAGVLRRGVVGCSGWGGGGDILPNTPVYVPATFKFEGKTWPYIGVRMKGNSSLSQTWRSGVSKLPLRLSFDKFEDEHPETQDQRFYGFKTLSLGNGAADASLMRDKIASDLFRESGVPAPRTAFVALYVDHGEGSQYWGLYTLDEDIDNNSLLDGYFGEHKGALYEADGTGARWGTFDEASFDIQANEEIGWTPVQEAINALHSDRSDAAAWRARLEQKLDVQGFLKWLAVNTVVQNWDAYGAMSHNYYLYAHSQENGRLHWITWDHDRSMGEGMGRSTSLTYDTTDATWPLIRYLLDDPTYKADYTRYALEAANGVMAPEPFQARLRAAHELITPWVVGENAEQPGYTFLSSPQAFIDAFSGTNGLLSFAARRQGEVKAALGAQP